MMKSKILFAAALAAAVLLAGCGSSSNTGKKQDNTAASVSDSEPADKGIIIPTDLGEIVDEEVTPDNLSEFVELGEYKGLFIEAAPDAPIEKDLTVYLDYKASVDGTEVEGVAAKGLELLIGMDDVMKGFDENLIGHKNGDEFSFDLEVPEDYPDDSISGKTVTYDVIIRNVYKQSPDIAYAFYMDSCTAKKYPSSLFESWSRIYLDNYAGFDGNASEAPSKKDVLSSMGMDEEMFDDMIKSVVKEVLVIESIFQVEQTDRESEEYQELMNEYLEKSGYHSFDEAVSKGMPADYITNLVDMKMLEKILIKYEAK